MIEPQFQTVFFSVSHKLHAVASQLTSSAASYEHWSVRLLFKRLGQSVAARSVIAHLAAFAASAMACISHPSPWGSLLRADSSLTKTILLCPTCRCITCSPCSSRIYDYHIKELGVSMAHGANLSLPSILELFGSAQCTRIVMVTTTQWSYANTVS